MYMVESGAAEVFAREALALGLESEYRLCLVANLLDILAANYRTLGHCSDDWEFEFGRRPRFEFVPYRKTLHVC